MSALRATQPRTSEHRHSSRILSLPEVGLAGYSLSPYSISMGPRYKRGGERRPIDDVDGNGTTLRAMVLKVLESLRGKRLVPDSEDASNLLRVNRMEEFSSFIFVEFGVARSGLVGNLHQMATDTRVPIAAEDAAENFVRSVFVFPPKAHEAFWLAERAGSTSAVSIVEGKLSAAFKDQVGDFTTYIQPVAEWRAVNKWADSVLVTQLAFEAPRPKNSTQAMDVNGIHASLSVVVKPRGSLVLKQLLNKEGPRKKAVYGFLSNGIFKNSKGVSAGSVMEQGWKAKVTFKTPSGRTRSFGLATEDKAPTLVYEIASATGRQPVRRPEDTEVLKVCAEFVSDVTGTLVKNSSIAQEIEGARPTPY